MTSIRSTVFAGTPIFLGGFRILAAALVCAVFFSGCSDPPELEQAVPPVQTMVLAEGVTENFRRFPGEVSAVQSTEMSFDVAGRLIERPATQGGVFQQGDLLARLDPENFEARLATADSRLANARDEFTRRQQLHERGVISASEFDQFRTEFEVAESEQSQARRALEDTRLLAPFDGRVARTLVNNHQSVQPKQPVLVFQNVSSLEMDIEVPERLMSLGEQGVTAENARERLEGKVEFPALPGQRFPLELRSFSTEATPAARTFRVTFSLEPPAGSNILPGMTCSVLLRLLTATETAVEVGVFEVPVQAVGSLDGNPVLWSLDADSMQVFPLSVELEGPAGQSMRVRGDSLEPGMEIVISGVRFLSDGMTVSRMREVGR